MTIIEAINQVDNVKPNKYSISDKVRWLTKVDGMIKTEIIDTHETDEEIDFDGYTEENTNATLIAPAPYDDLYVKYLESQIDYANTEYGKYNNSAAAFNAAYSSFANYYNRTHMPKGKRLKFY